jgi:hypothetical protein
MVDTQLWLVRLVFPSESATSPGDTMPTKRLSRSVIIRPADRLRQRQKSAIDVTHDARGVLTILGWRRNAGRHTGMLARGGSALAHEFRAQDKTFDPFVAAVDLLVIVRKADRLDDRALLQGLIGPFHLQILYEGDRIAIGESIPGSIANHGLTGIGGRGHLRSRAPFTSRFVVNPLVILAGHALPLS